MMGLAAKSSTEDWFFDNILLGTKFKNLVFHLAYAFAQLAKERLTPKQLHLLFATRQTLRYYSNLSPTGLAEHLSKKLGLPLSTTKFNLAILKSAGLLETKFSGERKSTAHLSYGGQLLTRLLSEPKIE